MLSGVSLSDGDLLIGPCRLQRPRTTIREETGQGDPGTKGIIREEEPGPRTCSVNAKVLNGMIIMISRMIIMLSGRIIMFSGMIIMLSGVLLPVLL